MGRNQKTYTDEFKLEVVKEALKKDRTDTEVATQYDVPPTTLSDWKKAFCNGEIKTDSMKQLEKKYEQLQKQYAQALQELGKKQLEVEMLKKKTNSHYIL